MKILSVKNNETNSMFEVELGAKTWKTCLVNTKNNVARNIQIPGFRKGHIPQAELDRRISKQEIAMRALEKQQNTIIQDVIASSEFKKSNCIDSVNKMEVSKLEPTPVLKIYFDLIPKVENFTSKDIDEMSIPKFKEPNISDTMVKNQIKMMIKGDAMVSAKKDETIANGNIAVIDFKGYIDDKPFKGGEGNNYELEIGSKSFIGTFEDQLVGCKKGDKKTVNVTFPKDYGMKDYAGKPAKFDVTIRDVKEIEYPEITKEYCKKFMMDCNNEKELKDHIKGLFIQEAQMRHQDASMRLINDVISKKAKLNYFPNSLLEMHKNQIIRQYENEAKQAGFNTLDQYKKALKLTNEQFEEALTKQAKITLVIALVYEKLIDEYHLKVTEADKKDYLQKLTRYLGNEKQAKEMYEKNQDYANSNILRDKLFKKMVFENKKETSK